MDDITALLDREARDVEPSPGAYEGTLTRGQRRQRRRRIGAAALALAIATAGTAFAVTAFRSESPRPAAAAVLLPRITGLDVGDVERVLSAMGLRVGEIQFSEAPFVPKGIVVRQRPAPGNVATGSTVRLTVSNGLPHEHGYGRVYVKSVLIPLRHPGSFEWTSPPFPSLEWTPIVLKARVIGAARLAGPYREQRFFQDQRKLGTGQAWIRVRWRVSRVTGPAWFAILQIGQREHPDLCAIARHRYTKERKMLRLIQRAISHLESELRAATSPKRRATLSSMIARITAKRAAVKATIRLERARCPGLGG